MRCHSSSTSIGSAAEPETIKLHDVVPPILFESGVAQVPDSTVAELRVYFDRSVPDGDGGFEDRGGFWLTANLWGEQLINTDDQAKYIEEFTKNCKFCNDLGIKGIRVTTQEELVPAIKEASEHPGPVIVDFVIEKVDNVYPMIPAGQSIEELIEEPL